MGIGDDQPDPTQAAAGQGKEGRRTTSPSQKISASLAPVAMPRMSRCPSLFTPTTMVAATETIRPAYRKATVTRQMRRGKPLGRSEQFLHIGLGEL